MTEKWKKDGSRWSICISDGINAQKGHKLVLWDRRQRICYLSCWQMISHSTRNTFHILRRHTSPTSIISTMTEEWKPLKYGIRVIDHEKRRKRFATTAKAYTKTGKCKRDRVYRRKSLFNWMRPQSCTTSQQKEYTELMVANVASRAGKCGCVYPKLAAAVIHIGGKADIYFKMLRLTGIFAIRSLQESNCTQHCRTRK